MVPLRRRPGSAGEGRVILGSYGRFRAFWALRPARTWSAARAGPPESLVPGRPLEGRRPAAGRAASDAPSVLDGPWGRRTDRRADQCGRRADRRGRRASDSRRPHRGEQVRQRPAGPRTPGRAPGPECTAGPQRTGRANPRSPCSPRTQGTRGTPVHIDTGRPAPRRLPDYAMVMPRWPKSVASPGGHPHALPDLGHHPRGTEAAASPGPPGPRRRADPQPLANCWAAARARGHRWAHVNTGPEHAPPHGPPGTGRPGRTPRTTPGPPPHHPATAPAATNRAPMPLCDPAIRNASP